MESYDILIIGAGPAGTCAALRLLSLGYRVAMAESEVFPRHRLANPFLQASTIFLITWVRHICCRNHIASTSYRHR